MEIDDQMTEISSVLSAADYHKYIHQFETAIQKMAIEFKRSAEDVSVGLYEILISGVPAEKAIECLRDKCLADLRDWYLKQVKGTGNDRDEFGYRYNTRKNKEAMAIKHLQEKANGSRKTVPKNIAQAITEASKLGMDSLMPKAHTTSYDKCQFQIGRNGLAKLAKKIGIAELAKKVGWEGANQKLASAIKKLNVTLSEAAARDIEDIVFGNVPVQTNYENAEKKHCMCGQEVYDEYVYCADCLSAHHCISTVRSQLKDIPSGIRNVGDKITYHDRDRTAGVAVVSFEGRSKKNRIEVGNG